jgi:predicted CoA-binding protein
MSVESEILESYRVIAVVGLSPNPERTSHHVCSYLKEQGYRIIPVNPTTTEALGEVCYPDLISVPEGVEVVQVFRRSEDVPPVVDQAIKIGAKAIWMQEGIANDEAALKARQAGLLVVMDRCMLKEHRHMKGGW